MANEFSFPESSAIENINLPAPPSYKRGSGREEKFLNDVSNYLGNVFLAFSDISTAVRNGWLIHDARLVNLTVENIFAGAIITEVLWIGSEKAITLSGSTNQITIYDNQVPPKLRVLSGKLGAGTTQYGIECYDAGGTVRFRVSDITEIDGAIIKNATITGGKIIDAEIVTSKLADNSVNENKRIDLYTGTSAIDLASIPDGGFGTATRTFTHNLGRKVNITYHVQDFSFATASIASLFPINQTANEFKMYLCVHNQSGSAYDPASFTLEVGYF